MKATDWDAYYSKPYKTATITRKITSGKLVGILEEIRMELGKSLEIIELGGANSCFYDAIRNGNSPASYSILDNNTLGLRKFRERAPNTAGDLIEADVLSYESPKGYDVAFSVGLIEHFDEEDTRRSIKTHWALVKPGGYMVLFFPTPTWLYRVTRKAAELLGLWIFHDERPLRPEEVIAGLHPGATVTRKFIIWPIFLTQFALVVKKPYA